MPVIRRDPETGSPIPAPAARAPVVSPTGTNSPPDKALEELKGALAEQHLRTQTRVVRGLEALDQRDAERQRKTEQFLEAGFHDVAGRIDALRHEMRLADKSARRQVDQMAQRMDSALDGMVEILRYMKSEIASIQQSLDASRPGKIQSRPSRAPEDGLL